MKKHLLFLWCTLFIAPLFFVSCVKTTASTANNQDSTKPTSPTGTDTVATPKSWVVSTVAGSGVSGDLDGDSTHAEFNIPQFITIDLQGNLLVSDDGPSSRIRMISPSRQVTTWASDSVGSNTPLFDNIYGLVVDSKGNVFDNETNYIRKIVSGNSNGFFAGALQMGYQDNTGTSALFNMTMHMAIDRQDNIFLPDYDLSNVVRIRKITPAGVVTTLALQDNTGIKDSSDGSSWYDYAIAVDSADDIYVSSFQGRLIKKITPQGNVSIFAGNPNLGFQDGTGTNAGFQYIGDMTCDAAGNIWLTDDLQGAIRKVTPGGVVTTIVGPNSLGYTDGAAGVAQFKYPFGIAVAKDGTIYVADVGNFRIRKIALQ